MKNIVAAALLMVSGVRFADAKCMQPILATQFFAKEAKGGVVVGIEDKHGEVASLVVEKLVFTVDGKNGAFEKVDHAPGLTAYRLPATAKSGVIDGGKAGKAKVTALDAKTPLLDAPKVKSVLHEEHQSGRGSTEKTSVTIEGDAPADAVAIVITDGDGKALSWGKVEKGEGLAPYWRGRCGMLADGTESPGGSKTVKLFWVDKYGRASALSKAVKPVVKTNGNKYEL